MLRAICEAQNDNAALAVWIHKDKGAEMTDELLAELRLGEKTQGNDSMSSATRRLLFTVRKVQRTTSLWTSS